MERKIEEPFATIGEELDGDVGVVGDRGVGVEGGGDASSDSGGDAEDGRSLWKRELAK